MTTRTPVRSDPHANLLEDLERFLHAPEDELVGLATRDNAKTRGRGSRSRLSRPIVAQWRLVLAATAALVATAVLAAIFAIAISSPDDRPASPDARRAASHIAQSSSSLQGSASAIGSNPKTSDFAWSTEALLRLIGQHVMGSWRDSTSIPPEVLSDVKTGRIGGVVLFDDDVPRPTVAAYRALCERLQAAARAGHQPPLLIAVDQEGGQVRRLDGPPYQDAAQIGGSWSASFAAATATSALLRAAHINLDLAPVSDVPQVPDAFIGQRAFSASPELASGPVSAFVLGLQSRHVAATTKHFPGLGLATESTDLQSVRIDAPEAQLVADMAPFRAAVASGVRSVMVSSAVYAALDPSSPAVLSSQAIELLRNMGFHGVAISDALDTPALAGYGSQAAVRALRAGIDVVLYANGDGAGGYRALVGALRSGQLNREALTASTRRILELKEWVR